MSARSHARSTRRRLPRPLLALLAGLLGSGAAAQTVTVDSTSAVADFGGGQTVADLPGPDGRISFHEAVLAANNTPGPQTIAFAIPVAEYSTLWDAFMIDLPLDPLVLTDDGTLIDGTTQTAFVGDLNPDAAELGFDGVHPGTAGLPALIVQGDENVLRGIGRVRLRSTLAVIEGDRNVVEACTLFGASHSALEVRGHDNRIGGSAPGAGNTLTGGTYGLRIGAPASGTRVLGNDLITGIDYGLRIGACAGTLVGGPGPGEGNVLSASGHTGEEFVPIGGQVLVLGATGTVLQGNRIGTDASGIVDITTNGTVGVRLVDASDTLLGGPLPGMGNVISGQAGSNAIRYGVQVLDDSHGNVIQGNRIGTDVSGTQPLPNEIGIQFWLTSANEPLPHDNAVLDNVLAFHELSAVAVIGDTHGIRLSGNAIFGNGELGIDLTTATALPYEVAVNDPLDADGGPNQLQNHPLLTRATALPGGVAVSGVLSSAPSQTYRVELFASATADPSGHGEGERYLGALEVQTDAAGQAAFVTSLVGAVAVGEVLTATATDAAGNTSEFGRATTLVPAVAWTDLGLGLAGAAGTPALTATGDLLPGEQVSLAVSGAAPLAPAGLVLGASLLAAPFKGGVLLPTPDVLLTGLASDGAGALGVAATWAAGVPSGSVLLAQVWVQDGGAPGGWSATNGVARQVP